MTNRLIRDIEIKNLSRPERQRRTVCFDPQRGEQLSVTPAFPTRLCWLEPREPHHLRAAVAVALKALHKAYSLEISVA